MVERVVAAVVAATAKVAATVPARLEPLALMAVVLLALPVPRVAQAADVPVVLAVLVVLRVTIFPGTQMLCGSPLAPGGEVRLEDRTG